MPNKTAERQYRDECEKNCQIYRCIVTQMIGMEKKYPWVRNPVDENDLPQVKMMKQRHAQFMEVVQAAGRVFHQVHAFRGLPVHTVPMKALKGTDTEGDPEEDMIITFQRAVKHCLKKEAEETDSRNSESE